MARVFISHFSTVQDNDRYVSVCFFDALTKGFQECGHDVMHLISTRFIPKSWNGTNAMHDDIDQDRLAAEIRAFAPDLCIFANNSVPDVAYEVTNCPVILLLSDTVAFFNDKDHIRNKAYGDRLFFYAPFARDLKEIELYFGVNAGKILHLLPATGVQAEDCPVEHNISFIGSNFQNDKALGELLLQFADKPRLRKIIATLRRDTRSVSILSDEERGFIEQFVPISYFPFIFSARDRMLILALLAEDGLGLFGASNWHETALHFPDVAASYDPRKVYSLKHNQDIYNASKICLSVSHTQAQDGFPWRVMDIMASNGCLLSDFKSGLAQFTKGYVDLPMYESATEAKQLANKLLRDEPWRQDLVAGAQRCIAEKGRWIHRFRDMQDQLGLSLVSPQAKIGSVTNVFGEDYVLQPSILPPNIDDDIPPPPLDFSSNAKPLRHMKRLVGRLAKIISSAALRP